MTLIKHHKPEKSKTHDTNVNLLSFLALWRGMSLMAEAQGQLERWKVGSSGVQSQQKQRTQPSPRIKKIYAGHKRHPGLHKCFQRRKGHTAGLNFIGHIQRNALVHSWVQKHIHLRSWFGGICQFGHWGNQPGVHQQQNTSMYPLDPIFQLTYQTS